MRSYRGKRVLITGATGFIGKALALSLSQLGAQIFGVSRSMQTTDSGDYSWACGDLSNLADTRRIFLTSRPHVVFHLASEVVGARGIDYIGSTLQSNLVSAVNILICATEQNCDRVVLAGSMEEPAEDENPAIPSSPYAAAKWSASGYARMFNALYGTPVVVAKIFMTYGPGQRDEQKLIPYVVRSLLDGKTPLVSAGQRPVDWIYLEDVVEGLSRCGNTKGIDGKHLDLGTGKNTTVREVVEKLGAIAAPHIAISFGAVPDRIYETVRTANTEGTFIALGWRASIDLETGLRRTVEWYKAFPSAR